MNRRDFLKNIAGVTAAGIVLPDEEVVRRFWRGWSPAMQRNTSPNWMKTGYYDASLLSFDWLRADLTITSFTWDGRPFQTTHVVVPQYPQTFTLPEIAFP